MRNRAQYLVELRNQVEENDRVKIEVAPVAMRRRFWLRYKETYPLAAAAANRLLAVHVTTAAAERNWSAWGRMYDGIRNRLSIEVSEKCIFVKAKCSHKELAGDELVALDYVE